MEEIVKRITQILEEQQLSSSAFAEHHRRTAIFHFACLIRTKQTQFGIYPKDRSCVSGLLDRLVVVW